jgi:hypothetical protein
VVSWLSSATLDFLGFVFSREAIFVVVGDNFRVSPVAWFFLAVRFSLDCAVLQECRLPWSSLVKIVGCSVLLPGELPREDRAIGVSLPGHERFGVIF